MVYQNEDAVYMNMCVCVCLVEAHDGGTHIIFRKRLSNTKGSAYLDLYL